MKALAVPWRDRTGRLSVLKAAVFLGTLAPGLVMAWQWQSNELGPLRVTGAIDGTGLWSIRLLLVAFAVTPISRLANWPRVVVLRRMLGLAAMFYGMAHLCFYAADQNFAPLTIASEIVSRPYLATGFVALLGLIVLGWTSTDSWMRKMGRNWKRLHQSIFFLIALASFHFFMWSKVVTFEAVLVSGLFLWLTLWRAVPRRWQTSAPALTVLALVTAILSALIEAAWYDVFTRVHATRILFANFDFSGDLTPAVWVALVSLGIAALVAGRRVAR